MASGATSALPCSTSTTLTLVHPSRSEMHYMRTLQAEVWRGALSVEAYIRREEHLGSQDATRDGGIIYWVLCDTAESVEAGQERRILASCETVRRRALMAYETSGVMHVKESLTYGVQRVFCNPEFRRRGYTRRIMRELKELLSGQEVGSGIGGAPFSFLFSDIGKEFYASFEWRPFRSTHISLPSIQGSHPTTDLPQTTSLFSTSLNSLCAVDIKHVHNNLIESLNTSKVLVAFIPDAQTMQWHHAREEFIAIELFGTKPDIKGAIVGDEEGRRAWCIWEHEWTKSAGDEKNLGGKLYILRLAVESRNENDASTAKIATLIIAAQREAARWGLDVVELWDPTEEVLRGAKLALMLLSEPQSNANLIQREKLNVASLQWHGSESELEGVRSGNVMWIGIEKYTWC